MTAMVYTRIDNNATEEELQVALRSSSRDIRFAYELVDRDFTPIRRLSNVIAESGNITYNYLAEIKRTASFRVRDTEDEKIDYADQMIRPYFQLRLLDEIASDGTRTERWHEWPLGTFLMDAGKVRRENGFNVRSIQGYDPAAILIRQNPTSVRYRITSGTNIVGRVENVLNGRDLPHDITPSDEVQDVARDWDAGEGEDANWLKIINELLASIGYGSLFFDESGVAKSGPYEEPHEVTPLHSYITDEHSLITEELDRERDLFNAPNKWVLFTSDPDRLPLRSVVVNRTDGPTSIEGRGREIERREKHTEAISQFALDAQCRRMAAEDATAYEQIRFSTALMPTHGERNIIYIRHDPSGLDTKVAEMGWSLPLKAGELMTHDTRRVLDLASLETIV